jgi:signal transduction histidine kinase
LCFGCRNEGISVLYRLRILLVESNRYQALLIERALSGRFPSAVTARFSSSADAISELRRASYDVVIADADSINGDPEELLYAARSGNSSIILIVFGPSTISASLRATVNSWAERYVETDNHLPERLPDVIEEFSDRWQLADEPSGPLDARTRRGIVALTVSTLAHEVNNPLMAILGTSELLLGANAGLSDGQREKVRMIQESAQRIQVTLTELANLRHAEIRPTPVGPMLRPTSSRASR